MDNDIALKAVLEKLKQFGGNKILLLVSLLNKHSWLTYQNQSEKATEIYEQIYLLQCLICEDVLMDYGYVYNESGSYPLWNKNVSY